jgi:hypothetical protein
MVAGMLGLVLRRPGYFLHQPATWVHIGLAAISGMFIGLVLASLAWRRRVKLMAAHEGAR